MMFSIIMPTYKTNPAWFQRALDSVRGQTYRDWELIVIDDNEDDGWKARTREWETELDADSRVFFQYNSRNLGAAAARNAGIRNARGGISHFLTAMMRGIVGTLRR